jgi:hypothetical protein
MLPLSSQALLEVWEDGAQLHLVDRALLVLSRACPEHDYKTLAEMSLGRRDALLIAVRRQSFGDRLDMSAACPSCRERLELSLSCALLLAAPASDAGADGIERLSSGGYELVLRAPNSHDAAMAAACPNVEAAANLLFSRLVTCVNPAGSTADEIPQVVQRAAAEQLAAMDPLAEIRLDLSCPGCGHTWQDLLDVASFVWAEICSHAQRLLHEVHEIARAYGWSERDILGMSAMRRTLYLRLVGS